MSSNFAVHICGMLLDDPHQIVIIPAASAIHLNVCRCGDGDHAVLWWLVIVR